MRLFCLLYIPLLMNPHPTLKNQTKVWEGIGALNGVGVSGGARIQRCRRSFHGHYLHAFRLYGHVNRGRRNHCSRY